MNIKWLGHASFLIASKDNRIITDPFNEKLGYPMMGWSAEIVTISHQHWDHNADDCISGSPVVIEGPGQHEFGNISITGIAAYHDEHQGQQRGTNTIFKIYAEGITLVHLGDLGHVLHQEQVAAIGRPDILMLPVGGRYTVDAQKASEIVVQLRPRLVLPMHYQTPHLSFSLAPLENFISKYERVLKLPDLEIAAQDMDQEEPVIIVLDYLLG